MVRGARDSSGVNAMPATYIILIIGAVGGLLTIVGGIIVRVIEARMAAIKTELALVSGKTDVIHGLVNSAATRDAGIIAARDATIIALTKSLTDAQNTAKLLAQQAGPTKGTS